MVSLKVQLAKTQLRNLFKQTPKKEEPRRRVKEAVYKRINEKVIRRRLV
jgi:hypothetical protein